MRTLQAIVVLGVLVASPVAAGIRLHDLKPEDSCECDCYVGIHRLNAGADSDGFKSEIAEIKGDVSYLRVDGKPVLLKATDQETSFGWTIYENSEMDVRLEPHLQDSGTNKSGNKVYSGDLKVVRGRDSAIIQVTATDYCGDY